MKQQKEERKRKSSEGYREIGTKWWIGSKYNKAERGGKKWR